MMIMGKIKTIKVSLTLCIAFALPLAAVHSAEVAKPEITIQGSGFSLAVSHPGVVILEAKDKPPVTLKPKGEPLVTHADRQTPAGLAKSTTFRWRDDGGYTFTWTISRLEKHPCTTVQMTFENHSVSPVQLREFQLIGSPESAIKVDGMPEEWWLSTLDSHDSSIGGFHPSSDLATETGRKFLDTMTLYTDRGSKGLLFGAVGPAVSDVRFHCQVKKTGMTLKIASEMNDVIVDPGETRCSEEVLVSAEPFDTAAPALFRWLAATHGSRTARGPISGWCSWYSRGKKIDAKFIAELCDKVRAERDRLPLDVIQLDDGWQKAYGDWNVDRKKFPDGMKAVADQIRAAGAIPGIWLCPVRSSKGGAHPDGQNNEYLDPSHPAVQEFVRKVLRDRVEEGFRYFKLDFLWARNLKTRHDWKKTRLEITRDIYRVYREAVGEDSYLLACVGGFNRASFGFADASRIGTDTAREMKTLYKGVCLADCINAVGSTGWSNGVLFANDPDVTYLHLPNNDRLRTWYSYSGLLGGLMLTSEPLASLDPAAIQNFERLIPPAPDKGRAFDGQTDSWHRQFGFIAQRPWGNFASILLWNPADKPADVALAGVPLGPLGGKFHAWSFWDEKYLGIVDESFVAKALPGYGSAQLRLTQVSDDRPVVIGSTLHVAMGSAEIKNVESSPDGMTVTLTDAGARQGKLYMVSSKPLLLQSAEGCKASITLAGDNLWCVAINERLRNIPNTIRLKPATGEGR